MHLRKYRHTAQRPAFRIFAPSPICIFHNNIAAVRVGSRRFENYSPVYCVGLRVFDQIQRFFLYCDASRRVDSDTIEQVGLVIPIQSAAQKKRTAPITAAALCAAANAPLAVFCPVKNHI